MPLPASYFHSCIEDPAVRAHCAEVIARHHADMEAARLADEAAGYLDFADEPSPSLVDLEAEFAAVFGRAAA